MIFNTGYNLDNDALSLESGLSCPDDTLAQQSFANECDINTIVKRFGLTGEVPTNLRMPIPDDFVQAIDFHTALNEIKRAESEFLRVPADIRARFNNNPHDLIQFLADDANRPEAVKLGLIPEPPALSPSAAVPASIS